jgi:hypothetical protein
MWTQDKKTSIKQQNLYVYTTQHQEQNNNIYLEGYISKCYKNYFSERRGFNAQRQAAETEILPQILNFT